ncbi:MAG: Trk system potassium transporter TrkA [Ignavibacteria bacterium]|nr:MAG: Trk system potassium transporter TrkA [Ignavibacteria bacterium]
MTIEGSSTSIGVLKQSGIEDTDLLVAVTSSETTNINTAILGKKLGAKKAIARVASGEIVSDENLKIYKSLGIDYLIYPEELASKEVAKLINRSAATDIHEFENGKLSLIGLKLDRNTQFNRKSLFQIAEEYKHLKFRIVAIYRGMNTIIPSGNDIILPGDQIFVIMTPESIDEFITLSGQKEVKVNNIMILGGGRIGRKSAKLLEENNLNIKLIESNRERTFELADYLEKTLVIQGDGRDIDLLGQEGIIDMDAFIAVTNDAETNIITCLMAKHLGVPKTIALVENVDYLALTQTIGLDSLINKKLLAANNISRFIRRANIVTIATLHGIDADAVEYVAKEKSAITKKPIKKLSFPNGVIIGGYVRGEKGEIVTGDTQIEPGDKVVVFGLPESIKKAEKLFQ